MFQIPVPILTKFSSFLVEMVFFFFFQMTSSSLLAFPVVRTIDYHKLVTTDEKYSVWVRDDEPMLPADHSRRRTPFYLINSEWEWNARKAGEACGPKNFFRGGRTEGEGWGWKLQIAPKRTAFPVWMRSCPSIHSLGLIRSSLSPPGGAPLNASAARGEEKTEQASRRTENRRTEGPIPSVGPGKQTLASF